MRRAIMLVFAGLVLFATTAAGKSWPAPIQALADRGIRIVKKFDAPGEITGYAARAGNRWLAIYLMPDGKHMVVGTLLDAQGKALTGRTLKRIRQNHKPGDKSVWQRLKNSYWIADGSEDAEQIVYMFSDPNCPYCHKFWRFVRPWVKSGTLQVRHVLVGILKPSSIEKAAAIFAAENSSAALRRSQRHFHRGGIEPLDSVPAEIRRKLRANHRLMRQLNFYGTPGIVYRDAEGKVHKLQGAMIPADQIKAMLGSRPKQLSPE